MCSSSVPLLILSSATIEEEKDLLYFVKFNNINYISYVGNDLWEANFFRHFLKFRYLYKIIDAFYFFLYSFRICRKNKKVLILGAPNFRNRLVSWLLRKEFICYLRSLHPDPENLSSLSDKIGFLFRKLNIDTKITNPYKADKYLVTSSITEKFLISRNDQNIIKKIKNIGSIWLKDIILKNGNQRRIFYITQAFDEHNLFLQQKEQEIIIEHLRRTLANLDIEFIVKVHPRDKANYSLCKKFIGGSMDFLSSLTNADIIISTFSTLAFEASAIGANVKFVLFNSTEFHKRLYLINNIEYFLLSEDRFDETIQEILGSDEKKYNVFNDISLDYEILI